MIEYSNITSRGDREYNEDYIKFCQKKEEYIFVLADGLGAHGLGNIASENVCKIFCENYFNLGLEKTCELAQKKLIEYQNQNNTNNKMKTTITALVINEKLKNYKQLHLGDSRIYHFNRWHLFEQTLDHSVCQRLASANLITKDEIRYHKDRNKLLDVLGTPWSQEKPYILKENKLKRFEAILLCSDGFWELIDEKKMLKCLRKSKTPKQWLELMEQIVLENGKSKNMDNYSAIAIFYEG